MALWGLKKASLPHCTTDCSSRTGEAQPGGGPVLPFIWVCTHVFGFWTISHSPYQTPFCAYGAFSFFCQCFLCLIKCFFTIAFTCTTYPFFNQCGWDVINVSLVYISCRRRTHETPGYLHEPGRRGARRRRHILTPRQWRYMLCRTTILLTRGDVLELPMRRRNQPDRLRYRALPLLHDAFAPAYAYPSAAPRTSNCYTAYSLPHTAPAALHAPAAARMRLCRGLPGSSLLPMGITVWFSPRASANPTLFLPAIVLRSRIFAHRTDDILLAWRHLPAIEW